MNDVLLFAATFIAGLVIGTLVTLAVTRRAGGGRGAGDLRHELDAYRDDVANHYAETARKVDALTRAYKDVYDHLETGAYRLVGEEALRARLTDAEPTTVTLEGIGARHLTAKAATVTEPDTSSRATASTADAHEGDGEAEPSLPNWHERDVSPANVPDAWSSTDAEEGANAEDGPDAATPETGPATPGSLPARRAVEERETADPAAQSDAPAANGQIADDDSRERSDSGGEASKSSDVENDEVTPPDSRHGGDGDARVDAQGDAPVGDLDGESGTGRTMGNRT